MLLEKIKKDRIEAMKSGDTAKRSTLQLLLAKIEKAQIDNKATLTKEQIESVISKSLKELDKEIESYIEVNRSTESQELEKELLLTYLPKQLDEEEIKQHVEHAIDLTAKGEIKNPMQYLSMALKGKADMKLVSKLLTQQKQ